MDARKPMPLSFSRFARHGSSTRPLARPAMRRLILPLLAATALAAIGGAVVGRLVSDPADLPARPAAPAEPGLFDFPSVNQQAPRANTDATAPVQIIPDASPTPLPPARVPLPLRPPARAAGVERFDSCLPTCDSRDPARNVTAPTAAAARPGALVPPRAIGEAGTTPAAPGLIDQTVTLTRDAVTGMATQAGQWADQVKSVFVPN